MLGILLAAGRGTRMKSDQPKVLFSVNDEPMASVPLHCLLKKCDRVVVIIGYRGPLVRDKLMERALENFSAQELEEKLSFFTQDPPKGTGDAVRIAMKQMNQKLSEDESVLVLNGDLPLIQEESLNKIIESTQKNKLHSACYSFQTKNPKGLGRILRDTRGIFQGIREEKDATAEEKKIQEVNSGVYAFKASFLNEKIQLLDSNNAQGEFYLTDLLGNKETEIASEALLYKGKWDLSGVNTTYELAMARKVAQMRLQKKVSEEFGVDILEPMSTLISARSIFHGPCQIGPGTRLSGKCEIGAHVQIEGQSFLQNAKIADHVHIKWSCMIDSSSVEESAQIGPFAHIRPESQVGPQAKVGNFVELKKTILGQGSKVSHLSYLGDALVGTETNIGCGTITCNYDGIQKHQTVIGNHAFIGSDSQLVAPVQVGDHAYIATGTVLTQDLPSGALGLSRPELVIKDGYAKKLLERFKIKKKKSKENS